MHLHAVQIALALFVCPPALSSISSPRRSTRLHLLSAFSLLTFTAVLVRLELAALVAPFALEHLARGLVGVRELVVTGVVSAAATIGASSPALSSSAVPVLIRGTCSAEYRCRLVLLAEPDVAVA